MGPQLILDVTVGVPDRGVCNLLRVACLAIQSGSLTSFPRGHALPSKADWVHDPKTRNRRPPGAKWPLGRCGCADTASGGRATTINASQKRQPPDARIHPMLGAVSMRNRLCELGDKPPECRRCGLLDKLRATNVDVQTPPTTSTKFASPAMTLAAREPGRTHRPRRRWRTGSPTLPQGVGWMFNKSNRTPAALAQLRMDARREIIGCKSLRTHSEANCRDNIVMSPPAATANSACAIEDGAKEVRAQERHLRHNRARLL